MISVVIPHLIGVPGADEALKLCIKSFHEADEVIVVANEGIGYGPAVNLGLKMAHGDQIIVSNNDICRRYGSLKDLDMGMDFRVCVPRVYPEPRDHEPRAIFSINRITYSYILTWDGYFYDPRFEGGYFEDDDFIRRLHARQIGVYYNTDVGVDHLNGGGLSMKTIGEQEHYDANLLIFQEKYPDHHKYHRL